MATELYKRCRPDSFGAMVGQDAAVKTLTAMVEKDKIPHCLLFAGPSGTGKTTASLVLRRHLECSDHDFVEMDAASNGGVDVARQIRRDAGLTPMMGSTRVWLIDEAHKLTNEAQNALLKITENTPKHAYFFLATSVPEKIIAALKSRFTVIPFKAFSETQMMALLKKTTKEEKAKIGQTVIDRIVEAAAGNARSALTLLEKCLLLEDDDARLDCIQSNDTQQASIELARLLMKRPKWADVAKLLKAIGDEPETVRRICLGYFRAVLLGSGDPRMAYLINCFRDNYFDTGATGLALSCFEAVSGK